MSKRFGPKILAFLLTFSIGFIPLKGDTIAAGAAVGGPPGAAVVGAAAAIAYAQHRKNARQSTRDKHTKLRAGRDNTKNRQNKNWQPNLNKRRQN